jgi:hypothetical protein
VARQLGELNARAQGLSELVTRARDGMSDHAEGVDRSRSVRVEIGPDGLPTRIQVAPDWQRRLVPEAVGAAVTEAWQVATGHRLVTWASGLRQLPPPRSSGGPEVPDGRVGYVEPRPLEVIAEDLMRAFDDLAASETHPAPTAAEVTGSAGNGRLTLVLSPAGLVSCTAAARWAASQTGARLSMALGDALEEARARLASAPSANPLAALRASGGGLDTLFSEALALLTDRRRLAG